MTTHPPEKARAASRLLLDTWCEEKFEGAVDDLRHQIGGSADVAFVFVSPDWSPHLADLVEVVQIGLRCPHVVGCSAAGLVATGGESESVPGCSLLALRLPDATIQVEEWSGQPERWPKQPAEGAAAVLLGNPVRLAADPWLIEWNRLYPGRPAFGGLASGGMDPASMFLFTESGVSDAAALAIHFGGAVRVDGVHGSSSRAVGFPYVVTGVHGNSVLSLGGLPAYSRLEEVLEDAKRKGGDVLLKQGALHVGLAASEKEPGEVVVRPILGADEGSGALAVACQPRVGQTLSFHLRDPARADEVWRRELEAFGRRAGSESPVGGLLFPCLGRGTGFFQSPDHDAGLLADVLGRFPLAGCFANGEFAPMGGRLQAHAFSAVGALFMAGQGAAG